MMKKAVGYLRRNHPVVLERMHAKAKHREPTPFVPIEKLTTAKST